MSERQENDAARAVISAIAEQVGETDALQCMLGAYAKGKADGVAEERAAVVAFLLHHSTRLVRFQEWAKVESLRAMADQIEREQHLPKSEASDG